MQKYIALLRGINVSGQKIIRMEDLRSLMTRVGFSQVQTYIQSGNIIFCSIMTDTRLIAETIGKAITEKYNFHIPVIIRNAADLAKVRENNPFLKKNGTKLQALYVTLLEKKPANNFIDAMADCGLSPKICNMSGKEIYLHLMEGYGKTKWTNTFFEKKLKITATTRNWATILELIAMTETGECSDIKS